MDSYDSTLSNQIICLKLTQFDFNKSRNGTTSEAYLLLAKYFCDLNRGNTLSRYIELKLLLSNYYT
jgi:hypothetical protein